MMAQLGPVVMIIAAGTFLLLALLPLFFTQEKGWKKQFNIYACGLLALLLFPSIYFDLVIGQALVLVIWIGCWVMAILSNYRSPAKPVRVRKVKAPDTEVIQMASALDKIQILERLAKMKSEGVISSEEFNTQKRRIFG